MSREESPQALVVLRHGAEYTCSRVIIIRPPLLLHRSTRRREDSCTHHSPPELHGLDPARIADEHLGQPQEALSQFWGQQKELAIAVAACHPASVPNTSLNLVL
jgi:hypothetical protein